MNWLLWNWIYINRRIIRYILYDLRGIFSTFYDNLFIFLEFLIENEWQTHTANNGKQDKYAVQTKLSSFDLTENWGFSHLSSYYNILSLGFLNHLHVLVSYFLNILLKSRSSQRILIVLPYIIHGWTWRQKWLFLPRFINQLMQIHWLYIFQLFIS